MKRIFIYAAVYGGIGAVVGVLMALYTRDASLEQVVNLKREITVQTEPVQPEEKN